MDIKPRRRGRGSAWRRRARATFRISVLHRIRAYFFAGILVTAPVAITLALAWWFINYVDERIVPLLPEKWNPNTYLGDYFGFDVAIPGIGLLILILGVTLVGALTAGLIGRIFLSVGETIVARMPIVRSIYSASKQIMETVLRDQSDSFRQAVLIEYPRRGTWTLGFVTGQTTGEVEKHLGDSTINVYVPTTPNPTSGFLLFVQPDDLTPLEMDVEDAFKMLVSVGMVTPSGKDAATLADASPVSSDALESEVLPESKTSPVTRNEA